MRTIALAVLLTFSISLLTSCAGDHKKDLAYCALGGTAAGVLLGSLASPDKINPTVAVIGGTVFFLVCYAIEKASRDAAIEAAKTSKFVQRKTDGGEKVTARPVHYDQLNNCHEIVNEAWDRDNRYLGKVIRRVCDNGNGLEIVESRNEKI